MALTHLHLPNKLLASWDTLAVVPPSSWQPVPYTSSRLALRVGGKICMQVGCLHERPRLLKATYRGVYGSCLSLASSQQTGKL